MKLKQVEVKENETAVDNLFIFTIMEINEQIDDAQTESQLRGILIYERNVASVYLNIRDKNQRDSRSTQSNKLLFRDGMATSCNNMVANSRDLVSQPITGP